MASSACVRVLAFIAAKIAAIDRRIAALTDFRDELDRMRNQCVRENNCPSHQHDHGESICPLIEQCVTLRTVPAGERLFDMIEQIAR